MSERAALLDVDDLAVDFTTEDGAVHAVDGVSFDVPRGATVGVVGESGCGKTVTALSLVRLLPEATAKITRGRVTFEGEDLLGASERRLDSIRGRRIGYVFQEPSAALNPVYTIGFQIGEALRLHSSLGRAAAHERAIALLRKVGFGDAEHALRRYPHELSGGMRQRVVIAIAIANDPALLVADEPTSSLDATIQAQVLAIFRELTRDHSMSLLLIAHDLALVADVTERVVVLYAGVVAERGPTSDVLASPAHPYTRALLASAPRGDSYRVRGTKRARLPTIEGALPDLRNPPRGCRFQARCPEVMERCREEAVPLYPRPSGDGDVRCFLFDPDRDRDRGDA